MSNAFEIYIHIPFCVRKCAYCDFLSFSADERTQRAYVDALIAEVNGVNVAAGTVVPLCKSVFIGGGTPSILPASWLGEILAALRARFALADDVEITIEANPGTVDAEKLAKYKAAGIDRISFGCQSVHDDELAALGRIHRFEEVSESIRLARAAGFANINADLMFGIPGQTLSSWEQSLRQVAGLGVEHISAYSLILEEGTPLADRVDVATGTVDFVPVKYSDSGDALYRDKIYRPRCNIPSEEEEREMFEMTADILAEYGLEQYEISNYAKPGYACRHNVGYWTGVPYLGFGLGAASYLAGEQGACRYRNTADMAEYLRDSGEPAKLQREVQELSPDDLCAEFMILGLRMTGGVSAEEFRRRFGKSLEAAVGDVIEKHVETGLLARAGDRICLTRRGLSLANVVMRDFLG